MTRRALSLPLIVALLALNTRGASPARAGDDPRFALGFLQGLRERGYFDLALDYIGQLRVAPDVPAEVKGRLDFEEGRALIDSATRGTDPDVQKKQLDQARGLLDAYIKANPGKPESTEALVELAHLLYERGRTATIESGDAKTPAEKEAKLAESRGFFGNARDAYTQAFERLQSKYKTFPNFLDDGDPLKALKERTGSSMMQAELQRAVVDYEEAQTYPADAPQRKEILDRTGKAFEDVYKRHRTQLAGITARMWQGKCYEERGEFGPAKGIYDELMQHQDPRLLPLQKKVDYFRIILMGKRKDYALAADEAVNWLGHFPKDRRSYEALGIELELAKDLLAQVAEMNAGEKDKATRRASELLADVVRVYSPFKAEALALLQKVSPRTALSADSVAKMSFDDAVAQADASATSSEYDKAIALLRMALRKGAGTQAIDKLNRARFTLAYCCYMSKRYYEAAALTEHLVRRYPGGEWSAKATEIANAALVDAYNEAGPNGRPTLYIGDLRRLEDLSKYAAETWPDTDQGDIGRMTAGQIAAGMGRYDEGIRYFEGVRAAGSRWVDAQGSLGNVHYSLSRSLREKDPKKADAEIGKAIARLQAAVKSRKDSGAGAGDLGYLGNVCDLAEIDIEVGKPDEALKLVTPVAKALASQATTATLRSAYGRVVSIQLRGHIAAGQVDQAIADMTMLEGSGSGGSDRAQLYFQLGTLLEKEMEALRKKNDRITLDRVQAAFKKFLVALVASKSGQTFDSLYWAGASLLKLGESKKSEAKKDDGEFKEILKEADDVFDQILKVYGEDSAFLATPKAADKLLLVRLKQVTSLRLQGAFADAEARLAEVRQRSPRLLEVRMEQGYILSARAAAKKGTWASASKYWQNLAQNLRVLKPLPPDYYESWFQAALALRADGQATLARKTLAGVMQLNSSVGTPEMKARYQALLAEIK